MLRRTGLVAVVGSLGKSTTVRCIAAALDEPEPLLPFNQFGLLALNLLAIEPWRRRAVLEVGIDKPGEMAVYAEMVRPDIVVVTSIASDHIRQMTSLETTAQEKAAMLRGLPPSGIAVLNGDDPRVLAMRSSRSETLTYGFGRDHRVRCAEARLGSPDGTHLTVEIDGQKLALRSRLVGKVMAYPMLAALAVAKAFGLDLAAAAERLQNVVPLPGRLQSMTLATGARILRDDHKASAESFGCAFDLLAEIPAQRRLVLLGDVFEPAGDSESVYRKLALRLAKACDGAYLVGDDRRHWLSGLIEGGVSRNRIVDDLGSLGEAARSLQRTLRAGDVVLIKGRQEERLERVAFALAGRPVPCALRICDAVNLACDRCGGR
jgi:UDP-N-acetylmuramyl pentapeptide synthase